MSNGKDNKTNTNASGGAGSASESVTFASRFPNYTIYLESPEPKQIGPQVRYLGGTKVRFARGRYSTSDPKIVRALRAHPQFGKRFDQIDASAVDAETSAA